MPVTAQRRDPHTTYVFCVDIAGNAAAEFTECSGLEMSVKYDEVREGGQNEFVHRLPGRVEYGNLVLKRGYATTNELMDWCLSVLNRRQIQRRDVTVALMSLDNSQRLFQWTFLGAYPVKWSGPSFKAGEAAIAIETLELAHQGLQVR